MSFFGEMASVLGFDEAKLALGYNYVNYNGEAVYIEGITAVLRVDSDEMAFRIKHGVLYVAGTDLSVYELCEKSVLVRGNITAVETGEKRSGEQRSLSAGGAK